MKVITSTQSQTPVKSDFQSPSSAGHAKKATEITPSIEARTRLEGLTRSNSFCLKDVLLRGWTEGLVDKHLGEPDGTLTGRNNTIRLYGLDRVEQAENSEAFKLDMTKLKARREKSREIQPCDLLPAIFAVNRAAKRYRDAAQKQYSSGNHGLAGHARRRKELLYALKNKGIAEAYRQGRLIPAEMHGSLCLYRGEGYSFHWMLRPKEIEVPSGTETSVFIDAKPQGADEPKQRDAIALLSNLPSVDYAKFDIAEAPAFEKKIECFNCGQVGHIARECPDREYDDDDYFDDEFCP